MKPEIYGSEPLRKREVGSRYNEGEIPAEFVSIGEEHYRQIFYQAIGVVPNCICKRFQQKNYIKTLKVI